MGGHADPDGRRDAGNAGSPGASSWRPMAFGERAPRTIADPLIEPLWEGRRVLVRVQLDTPGDEEGVAGQVEMRDETGLALAGHPELQAALRAAIRARSIVADGYLTTLPELDAPIAVASSGPEAPTLGSSARDLLVGSRGGRRDRGADRLRRGGASGPGFGSSDAAGTADLVVTTFVAVDLLALDDEELFDVPLLERKRLLDSVLAVGALVRRSPHVRPPAGNWFRQWRAYGFRSMAVKDANSRYRPGTRSDDWTIAPIPDR